MKILNEPIVKYFAVFALFALALFLFTQALLSYKQYQFVGVGVSATNTITINGQGEVFAKPDIAAFTVTVREENKDQAKAQKALAEKINKIMDFLRKEGIAEKDIRTSYYNLSPRYEWEKSKRIFKGYVAEQSLRIKVRDTDKAPKILGAMSNFGASNVSTLSFEIDDKDKLKEEARAKAIQDAKAKAKRLAEELGVDLVRVVGFSENAFSGAPRPVYRMAKMLDGAVESAPDYEAELPLGENKIISNVSIEFEIR